MKALVTGSNGFIGSTLVEKLLHQGHQVTCLVRRQSNLAWLQNLPVAYSYASLSNGEGLEEAVAGMDWIFHLAGVTKARDRQGYVEGNVTITKRLLQACRLQQGLKKFVYVSSQAAAGPSLSGIPLTEADEPHPISIYGECKLAAEKEVLNLSRELPVVVLRPPSVYGPRDRDILVYFQNVNRGLVLVLGKGDPQISLVHVSDLVDGIILAAEQPTSNGKVFFISGDGYYDWNTIGREIAQAMERKTITIRTPVWLLYSVSWIARAMAQVTGKPALLNADKVREMVQPGWMCSNQSAKQELGFAPQYTLAQGVRQTGRWYRENGWL
ncbi:NAD-dependent epimerase/dehydratase family protein [bacterium]|nr:NAD-dependent epimerase/dehydratase family protein [bacterium]